MGWRPVIVKVKETDYQRFVQHGANAKWLMKRYDHFRKRYGGQYVAVHKEKVVDRDANLLQLRDRIAQQYENEPVFIQYVYTKKPRLIL